MKTYTTLLLMLAISYCAGQNLINNPSFEDTIPCAVYAGPPQLRPYFWFWPTLGSSDFFNTSQNCAVGGGVPVSPFGYQFPRSGEAHVGLAVFVGLPLVNSREYIEGILTDSLIANHKYCLTFYVCSSNTYLFNTDDIGAFFSPDSIKDYTTNQVLNKIPQVENTQGNMLSDTLNWMLVSGDFIAQGGEKFITIGNFKDDANTTLDTNSGGFYNGSYYFIDDVSLTDCTVGIHEIPVLTFTVAPNPASGKLIIKTENYQPVEAVLKVTDVLGKEAFQKKYGAGVKPGEIDVSKLATGVYFLSLQTRVGFYARKFVKE